MKNVIKSIIKFFMSSICPSCGEKTYDFDEDTCSNNNCEKNNKLQWGE